MPDIYSAGPFKAMPDSEPMPTTPMHELIQSIENNRKLMAELEQQLQIITNRLKEAREVEQSLRISLAPGLKSYGFQLAPETRISTGDYNPEREY